MSSDHVRKLIVSAGLTVQHRCAGCERLLLAFSRDVSEKWTCVECQVEGATMADFDDEGQKS